ncbi:MAG: dimethylargininase, partial [Acidobacteria bacterium Pan2503]|nr:dimethylargininase [Candidatus Acidoferrum panamensis]
GTIIVAAAFPRTRERVGALDYRVTPLDISELEKAEAGLTCSSLLFESSTG